MTARSIKQFYPDPTRWPSKAPFEKVLFIYIKRCLMGSVIEGVEEMEFCVGVPPKTALFQEASEPAGWLTCLPW